jgi:5-methylcytosine-specific restriction endonuclease McrA
MTDATCSEGVGKAINRWGVPTSGGLWEQILARMRQDNISLYMALATARPLGIADGVLRLGVESTALRRELTTKEMLAQLAVITSEVAKMSLRVEVGPLPDECASETPEKTQESNKVQLWQAAGYEDRSTGRLCSGKMHVLRDDDPARTVCGRYTWAIGGWGRGLSGADASTCGGCRNSIAAHARLVTQNAQTARWTAERQRNNEAWRERYEAYLTTPAWQARRQQVLARANYVCEGCGQQPASQAHHLTYRRLEHEMLFDLVAICMDCHRQIHSGDT